MMLIKNYFTYLRFGSPFLFCLILIFSSLIPEMKGIFISLVFIPIFYFAIFHPALLNAYMVFLLGVLADLMTELPFGSHSFLFVLLFFIARLNQLFLKDLSFKSLWILFIASSGILLLLQSFLFTVFSGSVIPVNFLVFQYVILILIYPLFFSFCSYLNKIAETI